MRILIIEDEEKLAESLKKGLEKSGYAADYILDGEAGQKRIELYQKDYDLVILDLMLPKKNGFEVCRDIRQKGITLPVLILTARDMTDDKILALDSGADDYLVKPFSFEELLARMRALLRRPPVSLDNDLAVGTITMKLAEREVYQSGERIDLTLKEFELLQYLMRHPGQAINREDLYLHLWDFADNAMSNIIDAHIKNLRRKLTMKEKDEATTIETIRGVGYRIKP
jgi:two-component system, OmpR family, copper resistance phosphate regulon response regulator CusR